MTQRDKWAPSVAASNYFGYANELRSLAHNQDFILGKRVEVMFLVPMPESWSKKKKEEMDGKSHEQKPDDDNYLKAFCDALKEDDCDIWDMRAVKFWVKTGEGKVIVLENRFTSGSISTYLNESARADVKSLLNKDVSPK